MLCLGRRQGQEIEVSGPCRITILRAVGNVRIGIEADRSVQIVRSELVRCDDEDEAFIDIGGEART